MISAIFYLLFFITGLVVGSFLNVVIFRYFADYSVVRPRSFCPKCFNSLKWIDLIPFLSFFILKGRCRYCSDTISPLYPLVELLTAFIFVICLMYFGLSAELLKYIFVFCLLLVISVIDHKEQIIPNRLVLLLFFWLLIWQYFFPVLSPLSVVIGFLAGGLLFFMIALLSKGGMGGGDIKLMAVLGFAAGWPYVLILFLLSFVLGAAAGITLLLFTQKTKKSPIAFAPFLSISYFIIVLAGTEMWEMYHFILI